MSTAALVGGLESQEFDMDDATSIDYAICCRVRMHENYCNL